MLAEDPAFGISFRKNFRIGELEEENKVLFYVGI